MKWSAEEDAFITQHRTAGVGSSLIAKTLGRSRSAIDGRAHRLGLPRKRLPTSGSLASRPAGGNGPAPIRPSMFALAEFDPVIARALNERLAGR